ncbi:hypothetical protein DGWBC_0061 [Dehalogenimonas sp. WBC-2]|nr:hypothetical protein DGWBC_0061 [Dehalogenimonas sp. WBC-2]
MVIVGMLIQIVKDKGIESDAQGKYYYFGCAESHVNPPNILQLYSMRNSAYIYIYFTLLFGITADE